MSKKLLHIGALASLGCATTFVFGFVLLLTQLLPYVELKQDPAEAVKFVLEHHIVLSTWNFVIYILFGVLLTILGIALHHRLAPVDIIMRQLIIAFGMVWVTLVLASGMLANVGLSRVVELAPVHPELAQSLWLSIITVTEGLGGSNEIVGGLWVLLISIAFWRGSLYSRALSLIGIVAGVAGILSTIPLLSELGAVFGLLLIGWFIYLSFLMARESAEIGFDLKKQSGA